MKSLVLMQRRTIAFVVVGLIVLSISLLVMAELKRVYVIVNMENSPIEIIKFGRYDHEDEDHISSVVEYKNVTNREIEALAITMVYYDAFNEREDGLRGISTDTLWPNVETRGAWSTYGEPSFVKTALAFVSAVRFMDGEVWKADLEEVVRKAVEIPALSFLSRTEMLEMEE